MSEDMVMFYMRSLSEQAKDDETRTKLVEAAAHGISWALVQCLLITTPPSFEKPEGTVN
jgi:hypothetical protein